MKYTKSFHIYLLLCFTALAHSVAYGQTIHDVCVSEVYAANVCSPAAPHNNSGVFAPPSITIKAGDQIRFWTRYVFLGGYGGSGAHDIRITGSPSHNVTLAMQTVSPWGPTSVLTPVFTTVGTYSMRCHNSDHCDLFADLFSGWPCSGYSVTVEPADILPIESWTLAAYQADRAVTLEWNTRGEQNTRHFEVERAGEQDETFVTLGTVPAAGNTPAGSYRFRDDLPGGQGTVLYRIRQVDTDGHASYSNVVSLSGRPADQLSLGVCPTLARDHIQVEYALLQDGPVRLHVYDMQGKRLATLYEALLPAGIHTQQLALPALPAQTYLLRAELAGRVQHTRFVVQ
ncbi:MAG: hypothetical protein KF690_08250 [Bacteroidetes bacterium]|nr:hypothetical protein [Bacteroidota bacterium]